MKHYSKQREAILLAVKSTDIHPTAFEIYKSVKGIIPNISLGTVYRNLSDLVKSGEIISLSVGDGTEHYDGDISAHLHLHCKKCGKIVDVPMKHSFAAKLAMENGFITESEIHIVYGLCNDCIQ